jgi:hypothetical protein
MQKKSNSSLKDENTDPVLGNDLKHPVYKALKKIGQGSFGKAYLV